MYACIYVRMRILTTCILVSRALPPRPATHHTAVFHARVHRVRPPRRCCRYDHVYSNSSIFPTFGLPQICATAVCHASELPFVFHEVPSFTGFTPVEDTFASQVRGDRVCWLSRNRELTPVEGALAR